MKRLWNPLVLAILCPAMVLVAASGAQATEPTAYSWSGLYIGGNAGYTWGDVDSQYTVPAGPTGAVSRELDGGIYGAHIGLQHQWRSFVFGVEGSYSGSAGDKIDERGLDAPIFAPAFDYYARMNSMLTAGGRVGWTPMSNWLIYASGGYASAKIETNFILRGPDIVGGHDVERHSGFYIGGGIEYALTRNWIFGVEYLHVDLDSKLHAPGLGGGVERTVDPDFDVVRARISYKFGWDDVAAPLK